MDKKIKVIVTGEAGFIGSHVTAALVKRGYDVHVIDNLSGGKKENVNPKTVLHIVSITDKDAIRPILKGAHCVFHLAALPRVQYSMEHPYETNEANVTGTLNVLIASHEVKVKKVIYSASSSACGDQKKMPLMEDMSASPKSPYGLQKYIGKLYCKVWNTVYGLPTVCLRYFNVYGPRNNAEGAYALVVAKFIQQKKNDEPLTITGDGKQTRDFTHVYNVMEANMLAMESKVINGDSFNIGAGNNQSINRIAELIGEPVIYILARFEPKDTLADNSRAKKILGWKPSVTIEEGIKELKSLAGIN